MSIFPCLTKSKITAQSQPSNFSNSVTLRVVKTKLKTTAKTTTKQTIISPFAFFGFQYSFLAENIELKDNVKKPSAAYSTRIEFEDVYKGGVFGIGSRFLFKKNFGLVFRTGITTRGRSEDTTPDPNAVAEPTIIGGLTVDCFINAGIEYHWNWK